MVRAFPELDSLTVSRKLRDYPRVEQQQGEARRLVDAFVWKAGLEADFALIVCLIGGTGTGKSTLFNSLAGRPISAVGIRRPCTLAAVIWAHENAAASLINCPFFDAEREDAPEVIWHQHSDDAHLVLVDTPDFDSVEISNRAVAENFFIISDIMIFVTSQEKYGDLTGSRILEMAVAWGKKTIVVMNKAVSDTAFDDFRDGLRLRGLADECLRVERLEAAPVVIAKLRERPGIAELFSMCGSARERERLRDFETERLRGRTLASLEKLRSLLGAHAERITAVNSTIGKCTGEVTREMEAHLDVIVSEDLEVQIRERLQDLLRKYDILFVPRMMVRNAVRKVLDLVAETLSLGSTHSATSKEEQDLRIKDLRQTMSAARLVPVESAVARLNLKIAELLAAGPGLEDLRDVAKASVPRLDAIKIRSLYGEEFPGVEQLLEEEFMRFRDGLSRLDEIKLYGSYTLWALFLITAEIVVGGGFTLLDALLNAAVVPFIPKWLVNLKVLEVLRDIGRRVDERHRGALRGIVEKQADLYTHEFYSLVPGEESLRKLADFKASLASDRRPADIT